MKSSGIVGGERGLGVVGLGNGFVGLGNWVVRPIWFGGREGELDVGGKVGIGLSELGRVRVGERRAGKVVGREVGEVLGSFGVAREGHFVEEGFEVGDLVGVGVGEVSVGGGRGGEGPTWVRRDLISSAELASKRGTALWSR